MVRVHAITSLNCLPFNSLSRGSNQGGIRRGSSVAERLLPTLFLPFTTGLVTLSLYQSWIIQE
jgi:hypothetical protein